MQDRSVKTLLPWSAPQEPSQRLVLFGMRRLAAGGLNDAHATHAFLIAFGLQFRRPLILLRALMAEVSRVSSRKIVIAPCCCGRMTAHERALLVAVTLAEDHPRIAHDILCQMLGVQNCLGALTSAQALASALSDLALPLSSTWAMDASDDLGIVAALGAGAADRLVDQPGAHHQPE